MGSDLYDRFGYEQIGRLRAKVEKLESERTWRTIDTVREYARVLVLWPSGHVSVSERQNGTWFRDVPDGDPIDGSPIHWMPLPESPE